MLCKRWCPTVALLPVSPPPTPTPRCSTEPVLPKVRVAWRAVPLVCPDPGLPPGLAQGGHGTQAGSCGGTVSLLGHTHQVPSSEPQMGGNTCP